MTGDRFLRNGGRLVMVYRGIERAQEVYDYGQSVADLFMIAVGSRTKGAGGTEEKSMD